LLSCEHVVYSLQSLTITEGFADDFATRPIFLLVHTEHCSGCSHTIIIVAFHWTERNRNVPDKREKYVFKKKLMYTLHRVVRTSM
jgi:hypothetical protein